VGDDRFTDAFSLIEEKKEIVEGTFFLFSKNSNRLFFFLDACLILSRGSMIPKGLSDGKRSC
jgi:hypothetical protein